ncbi:MAG: hypothetical protein Q8P76_02705 [bacterium]|nr:hypothetical protein [bacterium]
MFLKQILFPASILAGTVIGAGIFSLPFVFKAVGLTTGLFYLALFSIFYLAVYLIYSDLIRKTPGEHRLVGYAKIYFGRLGFGAALFIGLIQLFFVLTIYLILAPSFSQLFIADNFIYHLIAFWILGSTAILLNVRKIALLEFLMVAGILAIIFIIFGSGLKDFLGTFQGWGKLNLFSFSVVGPILFSLSGTLIIPEIIGYFRESRLSFSFLKPSLILGSLAPALAYAVFVMGIWGLSSVVSEDAVSGLAGRVSPVLLAVVGVLGFLSLISSYIVIGLNARKVLEHDLSWPAGLSASLVIFLPVILYFLGLQSFIGLVSLVGSVFLPLEIILIVAIWLKARKNIIIDITNN